MMNDMTTTHSIPPVDVFEGDDGWRLLADLPGVAGGDLQVSFDRGVLSFDGRRGQVRYSRQLRFGPEVDANRLEASFTAGVLQVELPKLEQARPRQIPVRAE